ncbi:hypothetical protein DMN91_011738 [Ooceraea biroi]|uniref:Uncharacterized protein n=1 Tax=Ooceraea biroi TaxID=2015173 RepID=A0A3L8D6D8_OOCBI|nr:hypothetical protein DMN91_011738 [Ooceraea biroi]
MVKGLLDYWSWKEFSISIFGTYLRLFAQRTYGSEDILRVNHDLLITMRWFSVGSDRTTAHWTFFCPPDATDAVEDPQPPNCIHNVADYQYQGEFSWTRNDNLRAH